MLVTDVPMLDPNIIGIACRGDTPAETRDTMMLVEVAEDCTRTVTRIPIMTPTTGLDKTSDDENNEDRLRPPSIRNELLRNVKEQTNKYREMNMLTVLTRPPVNRVIIDLPSSSRIFIFILCFVGFVLKYHN